MDFLAKTIGSFTGSSFPFNIGERFDNESNYPSVWAIHSGTLKSDGSKCTVFVFDAKSLYSGSKAPLAKNMIQKLKRLRIPGILKIIDSVENDNSLVVATEPVVPLYSVIDGISNDAKIWGLNSLLQTLKHTSTSCVHGNINIGSIYVNNAGEWVLGGLEVATSSEESILYTYGGLLPGLDKYSPPETSRDGWQAARNCPNVVDIWQFGVLIGEVFNGFGTGVATRRGNIPSVQLFNLIKILCNPNPRQRPTFSKLLANPSAMQAFHNDISDVSDSLQSLSISSDFTYNEFLEKVSVLDSKLPKDFINNKILPELVRCQGLGKGGVRSLTVVIKLAKYMDESSFKKSISPLLVQQFASPDRAIRMELLTSMPDYIEYLDKKTVSDKIFGHFATGFADTEPLIREQSVKSVQTIIDKLSDRQINGELLRLLAKTQNDTQPDIRANTTILLGKVANKFSGSTRSSVLVAAFSRALKDPHIPSRIASLMALGATADYFTPQECCSKLIGALSPALLDKDRSVRVQAAQTMDSFMKIVQAEVDRLNLKDERSESSTPTFYHRESELSGMQPQNNIQNKGSDFELNFGSVKFKLSSGNTGNEPVSEVKKDETKAVSPALENIISAQSSEDLWKSFDDPFSSKNNKSFAPEEGAADFDASEWGFDDIDSFEGSQPMPEPTRSVAATSNSENNFKTLNLNDATKSSTSRSSKNKGALKLKPKDKAKILLEPEINNEEDDNAWGNWS